MTRGGLHQMTRDGLGQKMITWGNRTPTLPNFKWLHRPREKQTPHLPANQYVTPSPCSINYVSPLDGGTRARASLAQLGRQVFFPETVLLIKPHLHSKRFAEKLILYCVSKKDSVSDLSKTKTIMQSLGLS